MIKSLVIIGLALSASLNVLAQTSGSASALAIQPMAVDCAQAASMSQELEAIIAEPGKRNATWDPTLSWVGGINSAQQRLASAKTVLWNIRTQCRGF